MTIGALAVAMVESPFQAALVALVRLPPLAEPSVVTAAKAAVALAAVAVLAQPEDGVAITAEANALPENYFVVLVHLPRRAGLDNAHRFVAG